MPVLIARPRRLAATVIPPAPTAYWVYTSDMLTGRAAPAAVGDATSTLLVGGDYDDSMISSSEISTNGVWSSSASSLYAVGHGASAGTVTSALVFGGFDSGWSKTNLVELWNGTSWATVQVLPASINRLGGGGTSSNAIAAGGMDSDWVLLDSAYKFDGTSWSTLATLPTAMYEGTLVGSASDAITSGGVYGW